MTDQLHPVPLQTAPARVQRASAIFAGATLVALGIFGFLAGIHQFSVCDSYNLIAVFFALGAALSASFYGGSAAAQGNVNGVVIAAGGGVAVLLIGAVVAFFFDPASRCSAAREITQAGSILRSNSGYLATVKNNFDEIERWMERIRLGPSNANKYLIDIERALANGESNLSFVVANELSALAALEAVSSSQPASKPQK